MRYVIAFSLCLMLLSIGCTQPLGGRPDEAQVYPKITLSQTSLQNALGFNTPTVSRGAVDQMKVTQPIRAKSDDALFIEYKVIWYDASRTPVRPHMSWTAKRLEPRQPDFITVLATSSKAVDYNIQIRWGKP